MNPVMAVITLVVLVGGASFILLLAAKSQREARLTAGDKAQADMDAVDAAKERSPKKHTHRWRYHSSAYNEPIGNAPKGSGDGIFELHMKLLYGFTNVTYTCTVDECTEVRVEEHIGKVSDPYLGTTYKPGDKEPK